MANVPPHILQLIQQPSSSAQLRPLEVTVQPAFLDEEEKRHAAWEAQGVDYDRLLTYNPSLAKQIDLKSDEAADLALRGLRLLGRNRALLMVDQEGMVDWPADSVVRLVNGSYVIFHDR